MPEPPNNIVDIDDDSDHPPRHRQYEQALQLFQNWEARFVRIGSTLEKQIDDSRFRQVMEETFQGLDSDFTLKIQRLRDKHLYIDENIPQWWTKGSGGMKGARLLGVDSNENLLKLWEELSHYDRLLEIHEQVVWNYLRRKNDTATPPPPPEPLTTGSINILNALTTFGAPDQAENFAANIEKNPPTDEQPVLTEPETSEIPLPPTTNFPTKRHQYKQILYLFQSWESRVAEMLTTINMEITEGAFRQALKMAFYDVDEDITHKIKALRAKHLHVNGGSDPKAPNWWLLAVEGNNGAYLKDVDTDSELFKLWEELSHYDRILGVYEGIVRNHVFRTHKLSEEEQLKKNPLIKKMISDPPLGVEPVSLGGLKPKETAPITAAPASLRPKT
ncbi:MAG: hypothetical protein LBE31_11200 [Deltaproteobacteria bacterium]|jgi:hypothetical protein|nr:hypothetical protein [Deltaproteobacteria bacterium]